MSVDPEEKREVIEVVAEPMEPEGEDASWSRGEAARRIRRGLSPILAGIIIDAVDVATIVHPLAGLLSGLVAGFILARHLGFRRLPRVGIAVACGIYCYFPPTSLFPLATMIGVFANISLSRDR